ncbi:MAG TPA: hypothetical protein ENI33_04555 [Thermoplasmatales archaeon]|nr:hypothetical protein [Thermoplasmatales archaeon]
MDRQDKMVIFAGVIILIIAVAGIVYHEKTYVSSEEIKKNSYRVTWEEYSDEIIENDFVGGDGWMNEYIIEMTKENACIHAVEVKIQWTDNLDFHGFIFPWNWTDKIDASVGISEMSFSQSSSGYGSIEITASKEPPKDFDAEAENMEEVNEIIKDMVMSKVTCKINLSITSKPLLIDRGNDFTLSIVYHYSIPNIQPL